MEINVQMKQAGKRDNKIAKMKLLVNSAPLTIEELLCCAVRAVYIQHYVKADRMEAFEVGDVRKAILCREEELADKAQSGKIDFGFLKNNGKISEEQAIEAALQAFRDGLIAVFIDLKQFENLSDSILLTGEETVTFVRLTMLTGRIW